MSTSLRICFWVNDPLELGNRQTTVMLIRAAVRAGHTVSVAGVGGLSRSTGGEITAEARTVATAWGQPPSESDPHLGELLQAASPRRADMSAQDVIAIRTNPARDPHRAPEHRAALAFGRVLHGLGVLVLNDPSGLTRASDKIYLSHLPPELTPPTLITRQAAELLAFVASQPGHCVLKPAAGTRGRNVFRVHSADPNVRQVIDVLVQEGMVLAQPFIPGAEQGDVRMILLDGEPLVVGGELAAIARRPGAGDFRSNLHQGGLPERAALTPTLQRIATALEPRLRQDGLWLTGVDVIGELVVELNVFSTGGLRDAERFTGRDFSAAIVGAMAARARVRTS